MYAEKYVLSNKIFYKWAKHVYTPVSQSKKKQKTKKKKNSS